jgi:hypothetical protein
VHYKATYGAEKAFRELLSRDWPLSASRKPSRGQPKVTV